MIRGGVVHLGALKLRDDRHALGHEESGRPLPGQNEDAEAEPAAQTTGAQHSGHATTLPRKRTVA
jgi:hypothetical protein